MKWLALFFLPVFSFSQTKDSMQQNYTYLALGDSYTIGEGVLLHKSFPYQIVQTLRNEGYHVAAPEIIAKTGWTTDELETAIADYSFLTKYDFITLLIGVNNQYRGRDIMEYKEQFEHLLKKSIALANGKAEHVIVLSIPDYGVTPFAAKSDTAKIAKEIDEYNTLNKAISIQYKVRYVDITEGSRESKGKEGSVVEDGLHPSAAEYTGWAKKAVAAAKNFLKK